jgi:hypothetical protein
LPIASIVSPGKLATIEASHAAERIGKLPGADHTAASRYLYN